MFRRKENTRKIILRFKLSLYLSIYLSQEAKGGEEHVQGSGRGEEEGAGDAQGSAKLFQVIFPTVLTTFLLPASVLVFRLCLSHYFKSSVLAFKFCHSMRVRHRVTYH